MTLSSSTYPPPFFTDVSFSFAHSLILCYLESTSAKFIYIILALSKFVAFLTDLVPILNKADDVWVFA